jgi:hypothetical protein
VEGSQTLGDVTSWDKVRRYGEAKGKALRLLIDVSEALEEKVEDAEPSEVNRLLSRREELIRLIDEMDQKIGGTSGLDRFFRVPLPEEAREKISAVFVPLKGMLLRIDDLDRRSLSALTIRREKAKALLAGMRQRLRVAHSYSETIRPPARFLDVRK